MEDKESQQRVCPPVRLRLIPVTIWDNLLHHRSHYSPSRVEGTHVIPDRESQVRDGYHDGDLVPGHQQSNQASLEHVGGEEGEKYDDEGEDETDVLDTENIMI